SFRGALQSFVRRLSQPQPSQKIIGGKQPGSDLCTFQRRVLPDALAPWRSNVVRTTTIQGSELRESQNGFMGGTHGRNQGGVGAACQFANGVVEEECGRRNLATASCGLQNPSMLSWLT